MNQTLHGLLFYIDSNDLLNRKTFKIEQNLDSLPTVTFLANSISPQPVTAYQVASSATPSSSYFPPTCDSLSSRFFCDPSSYCEIHGNGNQIFIQAINLDGTNDRAQSEIAPGGDPKDLLAITSSQPGVEVVVGYRQGGYGKAQVWRLNHPSRVTPTNISTYTGTVFSQLFSIVDPDPAQTLSLVAMTEMDGKPLTEKWITFDPV